MNIQIEIDYEHAFKWNISLFVSDVTYWHSSLIEITSQFYIHVLIFCVRRLYICPPTRAGLCHGLFKHWWYIYIYCVCNVSNQKICGSGAQWIPWGQEKEGMGSLITAVHVLQYMVCLYTPQASIVYKGAIYRDVS